MSLSRPVQDRLSFRNHKVISYEGNFIILSTGSCRFSRSYMKDLKKYGIRTVVNTTDDRSINQFGQLSEMGIKYINFEFLTGFVPMPSMYLDWNEIFKTNVNNNGEVRLAVHGSTNGTLLVGLGLLWLGKDFTNTVRELRRIGGYFTRCQLKYLQVRYIADNMEMALHPCAPHSRELVVYNSTFLNTL